MKKLTAQERHFLALVSQAVFANPFSEERTQADSEIAGLPPDAPESEKFNATLVRIRAFLDQLTHAGKANIATAAREDSEPLALAHLFHVFHLFRERFDELIQKQIRDGDACSPVPFASEVLGLLRDRGFSRDDSLRYFGMFYQLRRAYYFIDTTLPGSGESMRRLRLALWNNVFTHDTRLYARYLWNRMEDFSTLLLGETGTGKGTAAGAIGRSGFIPFDDRANTFTESFMRSFIAINLSQFPETLIESELFGHRKGAFTGAVEAHEGIFQRCSPHGAIFLDEIGDATVPVQTKLLQVLQERSFSPVGSHTRQRFHGRVIAATNHSLVQLRAEKLFRDDLFYRLCSDVIIVPPLRQRLAERPEELEELLAVTVRRIVGRDSPELVRLVAAAIDCEPGRDYAWPGNVRELEQCTRRVLLTRSYTGDPALAGGDIRARLLAQVDAGACSARDLLSGYCRLLYSRHGTFEDVARRTGLDRRTVKKHITGS